MLLLILLFTALPVLELALLIKIGRAIDVGPTIGLVVVTGVVGATLARHQGLRTLRRIQEDLAHGRVKRPAARPRTVAAARRGRPSRSHLRAANGSRTDLMTMVFNSRRPRWFRRKVQRLLRKLR